MTNYNPRRRNKKKRHQPDLVRRLTCRCCWARDEQRYLKYKRRKQEPA